MYSVAALMRSCKKRCLAIAVASEFLLTSILCAPVSAQSPESVLRTPTCAACRIEVTRLFTLDNGPENTQLEDWPSSIAMDSHGRVALAVRGGRGLAVLYDSLGRSPRRIGRIGGGPNEYKYPGAVAFGSEDTLSVFDIQLSRRTELIRPDRYVGSSTYLGRSVRLRLLPTGDALVVSSWGSNRFQVHSRTGTLLREWGPSRPPVPGGTRIPATFISNVVANRFWSVNAETYELEQWTIDGTRIARMRRSAGWLDTKRKISDGSLGTQPTTYVTDLHIDKEGRLWVLVNVASNDWKEGLKEPDKKEGFTSYPHRDFGLLYDSVVEVIDIKSMKLLQSVRIPGYLRFILSDSHLASLRQSEDGSPVVDLWRVQMTSIP